MWKFLVYRKCICYFLYEGKTTKFNCVKKFTLTQIMNVDIRKDENIQALYHKREFNAFVQDNYDNIYPVRIIETVVFEPS